MLARIWRGHSLSIVLTAIGGACMAYAVVLEAGKLFDTALSLGTGIWTVALYNALSGPLREVNRPEE